MDKFLEENGFCYDYKIVNFDGNSYRIGELITKYIESLQLSKADVSKRYSEKDTN